jgi:acetylornithine/N-succinyldiaminopimelate aminotransferase
VDEAGALLIADEIQTGVGRTGKFLGFEHDGVKADVVALAKGLGGGVPIGAMLCRSGLSEALPPGSHGSTFGGNPLASAAALTVLDVIEKDKLLDAVTQRGEELARRLAELATRHARLVEGTRGRGLLQALVLKEGVDARGVLGKLQDAGVLLTIAGGQALRVSPPLNISPEELGAALDVVERVLAAWP